jgi:hypothetical protein
MTSASGRSPRGRRDNGLDASEYVAAADVDPRVGEHLLDVLALAKIAAYLQPSSDLHPVTRTTTLPNRPTDRLWVDRRHLAEARDVIGRLDLGTGPGVHSAQEPGQHQAPPEATGAKSGHDDVSPAGGRHPDDTHPDSTHPDSTHPDGTHPDGTPRRRRREDLDVDAAWQQILASWDAPTADPVRPTSAPPSPRPAAGDSAAEPRAGGEGAAGDSVAGDLAAGEGAAGTRHRTGPAGPGDARNSGAAEPASTDGATEDGKPARPRSDRRPTAGPEPIVGLDVPFDEYEIVRDPDDEGFVPPAPPPLPRVSRHTVLAAVLIAAGLAVFFRPHVLPVTETAALLTGMACIVGGFAILIWRLRDGLTDDDPDDGAVV